MRMSFKLAWSQTLSLWKSGTLNVLVFALVLAVTAITSTGFFTQRIETALNQQGGLLLGADLAVQADHEIPENSIKAAQVQGITTVKTFEFPSMVVFGETNQLAEIKAVETGFPLRGNLTIGQHVTDTGNIVTHGPNTGEVWIEPRLANLLNVQVGDILEVGERQLRVSAILVREPSRGGDMFGFAPRLMMHAADLPSTKLIQYGSRVKYQLLLAAQPQSISKYAEQAKPLLLRGEKIQDIRNARPEIKSALDKAQQFLGLSSMVSVILAMVAMLLSSLPYIKQSLDTFALMRCFGASKNSVLQVLAFQTMMIALLSGLFGAALGYVGQLGLAQLAGNLFVETLPAANATPLFLGLVASLGMMLAVVVPHAWQMRNLTAMNILRRETISQTLTAQAKFLPAFLVMTLMIFWQARDIKLALATIVSLTALCFAIAGIAYLLVNLLSRTFQLSSRNPVLSQIKIGVLGLKRRFSLSTVQMIGFSMGLMVLMLLALIRNDLIRNWQASLPIDAPNRFVINIQPAQISGIKEFFAQQNIQDATIFPMVRGRLVKQNGHDLSLTEWKDERAKRLAEREFNLSWAAHMQSDNKLLSGKWWTEKDHGKPYLSLEQDLAKTLGIKLGDQLVFNVAGTPLNLTVTSIRKVEWDTMRANFFAVTPPGLLEQYPTSHMSSFYLPLSADAPMNQLIRSYPNLTVIDVAALMQQVRSIMQKMSSAIEYVFAFSLIAGIAVLYASVVATRDERVTESTLMRVFGASRQQVSVAYLAEFSCIGLIAALVAAIGANLLAYYLSYYVLDIPFQLNFMLAITVMLISAICIPLAAWLVLRKFLNIPARQLLNSI